MFAPPLASGRSKNAGTMSRPPIKGDLFMGAVALRVFHNTHTLLSKWKIWRVLARWLIIKVNLPRGHLHATRKSQGVSELSHWVALNN